MKEVTEWDNNPREMWVWDTGWSRYRRKVKFIIPKRLNAIYPVIVESEDGSYTQSFQHCAEMEIEPSRRRMTNKELARWLREKPNREYKRDGGVYVYSHYDYVENAQDDRVDDDIYVREGDSPWFVPFAEEE